MVIESIYTLFQDGQTPSVEEVAAAVVKGLGLEQEWAVAEYDSCGKLSHVSHRDYQFASVYRTLSALQDQYESENLVIEGSFGLATHLFTAWSKV